MFLDDDDPEDEKVGYRKPPKRTRFRPGECGRDRAPGGRLSIPRRKKMMDDLYRAAAKRKTTVVENGSKVTKPMPLALFDRAIALAAAGKNPKHLLEMLRGFEKANALGDRPMTVEERTAWAIESMTKEDWAALEKLKQEFGKYHYVPADEDDAAAKPEGRDGGDDDEPPRRR